MYSMFKHYAKSTKIHCSKRHTDVSVFQIHPPRGHVTLDDIEDMRIVCTGLTPKHAKDLYFSVGIDYENANRYYEIVKHLEKCYKVNRAASTSKYLLALCCVVLSTILRHHSKNE